MPPHSLDSQTTQPFRVAAGILDYVLWRSPFFFNQNTEKPKENSSYAAAGMLLYLLSPASEFEDSGLL